VATWNPGNHLIICLEPSQHLLGTISAFAWNNLSICLEPSQHLLRTISAFAAAAADDDDDNNNSKFNVNIWAVVFSWE
jgi:hypothetical protein